MDSHVQDLLPTFWSRLFPFEAVYEWLNYGEEQLFTNREFSMNFGNGDRFLRYISYNNIEELKFHIKQQLPNKIDIGAVYSVPPKLTKKSGTTQKPVQKELFLDIDLTDYDDVRVCCSQANTCKKCWKYVSLAVKILDVALREDFGFEHILWVFSGRRGVHAWVCDKKARSLSSGVRLAICNYLQLLKGGDHVKKKVNLPIFLHEAEKRAIKLIDDVFVDLCVIEQNMLGTEENIIKFLDLFNEIYRSEIKEYLEQYSTSILRWQAFLKLFNRNKKKKIFKEWLEKPHLIEEIKIQYAYPRIDLQVTYGLSHLLKAPFSIHPKTGIVGVPIDHERIDDFDPHSLPTVLQLMDELDQYTRIAKEKECDTGFVNYFHNLEKTSLGDSYRFFRAFIKQLKNDLFNK